MTKINKLTLGIFKPTDIDSISFVKELSKIKGVDAITLKILSDFRGVEETKMDLRGMDLDIDRIRTKLKKMKSSLSGIEGVSCGESIY